ncbi:Polymerase/histidinol phosphatase-like protein [Dichotomopilus funicola]|uniref:Histidinol-phosphatase n=1 Tax=Dichotomopilus funicola TaxID=1934379 RepID=A0AAN6V4G6_9PEZI|nr:Polymerase/histidinol phosphatase-like protein [Dichotomopilus funicola]
MAFTMHSHSGQFCPGHAKDQLEEVILHAIKVGYKTIGLSEHMPRTELGDLYPEELTPSPTESLAALLPRHTAYLTEARRLQTHYASQIHILIGFEGEWIRSAYGAIIHSLAADPSIDYFIGSLHHTRGVPIDFDRAYYARAVEACGGEEEKVYEAYFDEQWEMLQALRPRVVGHFDLVRLMSSDPGREIRVASASGAETTASGWGSGVWERVVRNLEFVKGYGGWLECNTSGLRKGMAEPYPKREIAEEWVRIGGRWTFGDDSHGIAQVGTNYWKGLEYLEGLGVKELWTLERRPGGEDGVKAEVVEKSVSIEEFRASLKLE